MKMASLIRAMLLVSVSPLIFGQQQTAEPKDETASLLSRKIGHVNAQRTDAVFALQMDIGTAQLPGGIFSCRIVA